MIIDVLWMEVVSFGEKKLWNGGTTNSILH